MRVSASWLPAVVAVALVFSMPALDGAAAKKKKAPPPPAEPPMKVVVVRSSVDGCEPFCPEWIAAEGPITAKTPALFKKVLAKTGDKRLPVIITSPGGDVEAALAIGEMIRARQLDIAVGWTYYFGCAPDKKDCKLPKEQKGVYRGVAMTGRGYCFSACSFVLASGQKRVAGAGTYVGVHQISRTITEQQVRYRETYRMVNGKKKLLSRKVVSRKPVKTYTSTKLNKAARKKLARYVDKMGLDAGFLDLFDKAPPTSIHVLDQKEATAAKLVSDIAPAMSLVDSSLCKTTPPAGNCVLLADTSGAATTQ